MSVAFVSNRVYPLTLPLGDLALVRLSRLAVAGVRWLGGAVPEPEDRDDSVA